ncbi:radical SAM/SPASM domain-containing protein [Paraclostridium bifermentans]|uniref:radical SAM/SPASM domain-containing protein n=1 Tax=Paraclostridium bifermentans TaxID=1490 RepID=UPI0011DE484B|nr:radical SAM protein [Paraclostridium bifermentans]
MQFKLSENAKIIINRNKVILGNTHTGQWIRISQEVYKIFKLGIDNNLDLKNLKEYLYDNEDRAYIEDMYMKLCKIGVIEDKSNKKDVKNKSILFEITNRCNLKCTHCCIDADGAISDKKELNTSEVKSILDKLIQWNPQSITLTGGEPMLRKDFFEILKYLKKNYNGQVCLSTNGTLINEDNVEKLIEFTDQIDISIDGIDEETCSIVRGKGVFSKVISSVQLLQKSGFKKISLSMIFGKKNSHLKKEFVNLNNSLKTYPIVREFKAIGRGETNKKLFDGEKDENLILDREFITGEFRKTFNIRSCTAGEKEFFIRYNGDIYPCQYFLREDCIIANMMNIKSLDSIRLNKDKYKNSSKNLVLNLLDNTRCRDCNVNLFCWPCPGEIPEMIKDEEYFDKICKEIKPILYKEIWG